MYDTRAKDLIADTRSLVVGSLLADSHLEWIMERIKWRLHEMSHAAISADSLLDFASDTHQSQLFSTFCVNVKMQYTLNQRLFLVKQYWITNSITATQRAYQREFGVRNPPKRNTILGLVNKLETTGSLVSEKGKHRSCRLPTVVVDVRERLEQSPKKTLRRLSQ
ncbi:hypothetical protein ANN_22829 [Periplaneta americana]|uniref:DUF4817 domain-containing protein n=1 Tax=Periplaneta americana TaxID=6978 RepID=A0ABQ8SJJ2_PERAM|nr:hypothetical protein ANN_22829 [Periplaneta americana]